MGNLLSGNSIPEVVPEVPRSRTIHQDLILPCYPVPVHSNALPYDSQMSLPVKNRQPAPRYSSPATSSVNAAPIQGIVSLRRQLSQLELTTTGQSVEPVTGSEHACAYCGIDDPGCVVLCETSKKWFCNGGRNKSPKSHIITHLTRARKKIVLRLHGASAHQDILLKCRECGCSNVFQLGFCLNKQDPMQLLCRAVCFEKYSCENNLKNWKPIISDGQFVSWLLGIPSVEGRSISVEQIKLLEESWRVNPQLTVDDLETPVPKLRLKPVCRRYWSSIKYRETFGNLIMAEAAYDKSVKESLKLENMKLRWVETPSGDHVAYFSMPDAKEGLGDHVTLGDEVIINRDGQPTGTSPCMGRVISIPEGSNNEIGVEMGKLHFEPTNSNTYTIQFKWKSVSYARMQKAISKVTEERIDLFTPYLFYTLLGEKKMVAKKLCSDLPEQLSVPHLQQLNPSQVYAVKTAVQQRLTLIQGPPGTGKTTTSATIIYQINKVYQGKVLAVAPSNIAADNLCAQIDRTGLKVTRMYARAREGLPSSIRPGLTLHEQITKLEGYEELKCLKAAKKHCGVLGEQGEKRFRELLWELENKVLSDADVICCTCITAGDPRLEPVRFHSILIDEAAQATEPECLVPITRGCCQLVMVGDHCQLGPLIRCQQTAKAGLTLSLFERLVLLGNLPIRLKIQYRMHPALSEFSNHTFYEGTVQDGVSAEDRQRKIHFPWPNPNIPMVFYRVSGDEELAANRTSHLNRFEAEAVGEILAGLLKGGLDAKSIGVITMYEGQRAHILHQLRYRQRLNLNQYGDSLEIANVDGFQGREKDYIIVSCVRSNRHHQIGFLADPRRLNVALTRARYGLIIVGNPSTLSHHGVWSALLHFYQDRKLLVDGSLTSLTNYVMQCKRPQNPYKFSASRYYRDDA